MISDETITYLENEMPKLRALYFHKNCCSKMRAKHLQKLMADVFDKINLQFRYERDIDDSYVEMNKHLFNISTCITGEKRQKILNIIRSNKKGVSNGSTKINNARK